MDTDEAARLNTLRSYRILDTEPEKAFDDLTLLASQICGTPIALITLIDRDRQWIKSRVGLSVTETSRDVAFCNHAIRQRETFVVPDATRDERFRENPFVTGEPRIRFYAGAPLVTAEGHGLGTLCVIDRRPRQLTPGQQEALEALRRQAVAQLELRRSLDELAEALRERDRAEAQLRESLDNVGKLSGLVPLLAHCRFNVVIPADPAKIGTVTEGVMQVVREKLGEGPDTLKVEIALQEALANAVKHGCGNDPGKQVQCCVTLDEHGELIVVVRDPGAGFEPAAVPDPLQGEGRLKASGRGIFLINQFMDEVRFADGGRTLRMRKKLR